MQVHMTHAQMRILSVSSPPLCSPHVFWFFSVSPSHIILSLALLSVIILSLSFAFFFLLSVNLRRYRSWSRSVLVHITPFLSCLTPPSQRRHFLPFNCFFIFLLFFCFHTTVKIAAMALTYPSSKTTLAFVKVSWLSVINVKKRSLLIPHHIIRHCWHFVTD